MIEQITMWYFILGLLTSFIGVYRAYTGKSDNHDIMTSFSWFLLWWIYLPIFIVRYTKYKLKGKTL